MLNFSDNNFRPEKLYHSISKHKTVISLSFISQHIQLIYTLLINLHEKTKLYILSSSSTVEVEKPTSIIGLSQLELAYKNSLHFAMLPLVFPTEEQAQKFYTHEVLLPRSGLCCMERLLQLIRSMT